MSEQERRRGFVGDWLAAPARAETIIDGDDFEAAQRDPKVRALLAEAEQAALEKLDSRSQIGVPRGLFCG